MPQLILLQALQQQCQDADIPVEYEDGPVWGHGENRPHLAIGDINVWVFNGDVVISWFDHLKFRAKYPTQYVSQHIKEEFFEAPEDPNYLQRIHKRLHEINDYLRPKC